MLRSNTEATASLTEKEKIMNEQSVVYSTFVIERSFQQAPERVFSAFADPALKRRWFAEGGNHEIEKFEMDFRVGGAERLTYRFKEGTPFQGVEVINEGSYLDVVTNGRVVTASTMALGGKRISAALVTIEVLSTGKGTDLICTHQGAFFEGADGPQIREAGWRHLFGQLDKELARQ
jgi:uncharacterized protein YndB with AHSA1/START domain